MASGYDEEELGRYWAQPGTVDEEIAAVVKGHHSLDLHNKNLTEVPAAVRDLAHMESLHLYGNELTALPEWLDEPPKLDLINASNNRITTVPERLWTSAVTKIWLWGNPLDVRFYADAYVERFNAAVRSGDFGPFVKTLDPDAVMSFDNASFEGRSSLLAAYREQPPTDTMQVLSAEGDVGRGMRVRFAWDRGGTGTMELGTERAGRVSRIRVSFD